MKRKDHAQQDNVLFQVLLCILIIISCICINAMKQKASVNVGAFGTNFKQTNYSFSDLAQTLENKFIEKSVQNAH